MSLKKLSYPINFYPQDRQPTDPKEQIIPFIGFESIWCLLIAVM